MVLKYAQAKSFGPTYNNQNRIRTNIKYCESLSPTNVGHREDYFLFFIVKSHVEQLFAQ